MVSYILNSLIIRLLCILGFTINGFAKIESSSEFRFVFVPFMVVFFLGVIMNWEGLREN